MMQAAHERKVVLQAKEADRALRCARTAAARALEEALKLAQVRAAQSFESNLCGVYHSIYGPVPCNRPYYECPFLSHALYRQHKSEKGVVDLTPCVHHPIFLRDKCHPCLHNCRRKLLYRFHNRPLPSSARCQGSTGSSRGSSSGTTSGGPSRVEPVSPRSQSRVEPVSPDYSPPGSPRDSELAF
jgi:hypothetical protein